MFFFFFFLSSFFPLFFSYHRICIADISSFDIITPSRGRGLCNNFHIGSIEKRRYLRLLWRYAKIAETTRLNKVTAHGEIKIRLHRIRVLFFPSNHLQREYSDNYRPLFLRKLNIQNTQKKFDDKKKNKNKKIQYIASKLSAPTNSPSWTLPIKFDYCAFSSFFIKQSNFQLSFPSFSPVFTNKFIIELHVRSKHLPRL